jgi:hypothetical protein
MNFEFGLLGLFHTTVYFSVNILLVYGLYLQFTEKFIIIFNTEKNLVILKRLSSKKEFIFNQYSIFEFDLNRFNYYFEKPEDENKARIILAKIISKEEYFKKLITQLSTISKARF